MDSPETSTGAGCSQERGGGKKLKDSKMTQRCSDRLTETPRTGNISASLDTKTEESGAIPPLQPANWEGISTWRKMQSVPPPGKQCSQSAVNILSESLHKKEQKPKKTGKYVCHYCGRACAKPSVLKKHIRSHTGERPYPCVPCGFSFKTKSNLYKHRKSHTHAVKAGLVAFSEQDSKNLVVDEELTVEGDMHSDAEQSTDTDEDTTEDVTLETGTSVNIKNSGEKESVMTLTSCSSKKQTVSSSGKVSLWQFREMKAPPFVNQVEQEVEPSTVKQRLALRLSEKRSQDSDQSLSLPSSYSKGSTDSGYFSRSESAEQQFGQPSSSAKSYQEIMFGKCYRPSSKPRQSITVQTCMTDITESTSNFMIKLTKGMVPGEAASQLHRHKKDLIRSIKIESESFQEEECQDIPGVIQCSSKLLENPSESGLLLRSNSLPTPSDSNLNAPQGLRSSNSFDERMTSEEVSYRGSVGMRRLMRQSAFEHSGHESHAESDHHSFVLSGLKTELKMHIVEDSKVGIENYPEFESSQLFQSHMTENITRKRRKGKNVVEDEDLLTQSSAGDFHSKFFQDIAYLDSERGPGSNVISVIQHTNTLSKLNSAEKSTDMESHQTFQISEKVQIKERQKTDHFSRTDRQWGGSNLYQRPKHVPQPGIQVPEIRVTEEPDRPVKGQDVQVQSKEKHGEEFQWPQRSETLSKFPVEKLPPKKKRLRLAEMECSSGESSFESACTSLSRSPSQDSNLSHSSSFSQSLDKEEIVNVASPARSDDFSKPLEFLSVPGGSQSHSREMRRSASEQAPCSLTMELPEFRSKSFDYGNLSFPSNSMQCDIYTSASRPTERRRGYLVRQSSLSGDPETLQHDKSLNINAAQRMPDPFETGKRMSSLDKPLVLEVCSSGIDKMKYSLIHGNFSTRQLISTEPFPPQMKEYHELKHEIKTNPREPKATEDLRCAVTDLPKIQPQSITNVLSSIAVLSQAQPALASQGDCGLLVPVRIQMQVPSNGKITYTSISHILDSQSSSSGRNSHFTSQSHALGVTMQQRIDFDLSQISGCPRGMLHNPQLSPAKLKTGIPLSLTSRTISTTEAPSGGANKRMLSPASSIELFIEAKQQKRGKDEKMYGQIVEELSAVELGHHDQGNERFKKESNSTNVQEQSVTVEEVDMDNPIIDCYPKAEFPFSSCAPQETGLLKAISMSVQAAQSQDYFTGTTAVPRDNTNTWKLSQFPGLHTTTCVSWCYLNSSKPNSTQTAPRFSVYASWFVRCHNPNPPNLSTAMVLALLRSKQKRQNTTYTIAAMYQPGIFVTSTLWSQKQEQVTMECRVDGLRYDTRTKDTKQKSNFLQEDNKDTETSLRPREPIRIKIFEGGYKSNEDYVYVRGRGRGKYICEECGIRCKKPSMLKKHIRTHTDVRPYICKSCNFAFKTKGNLTKHMKSKAHMKKCLELGVSSVAMDITDDADNEDDVQKSSDSPSVDTIIKHQFSDAEDSDGGDEDGDEPDDEEDDDYDGDSTPRTLSRSTSPQPCTAKKFFPSSCLPKCLDIGTSHRERPESSFPYTEDNLNLEQGSTSFDPYSPHLLSPCWESPHQRYISPRNDLSSHGHPSPGRDTSPLRAISPRRDLNLRGDLSPIRQLSPVRPLSPGTEVSRHRAPSPRGRNRSMLRAASPRRGSYQHRAYLDQSRGVRFEASSLRQTIGMQPEMDQRDVSLQNLYVSDCIRNDSSNLPQQDIFSHLPLHSQRRVPSPIPMVPIGGLRMPSVSSCGAADIQSQSLKGDISERVDSSHTSVPVPGPEKRDPMSQHIEKPTSCPGLARSDKKQEESIHSCAEAIASLRITSEDITDKPPKS